MNERYLVFFFDKKYLDEYFKWEYDAVKYQKI